MNEHVREISAQDFDEHVLRAENVVVDFYSTECPPCEALAPKYDSLAELYHEKIKFVKIHRQANRALAESLGVKSSPTVLFYQHGRVLPHRLGGAVRRSELAAQLDSLLSPAEVIRIRSRIKPVSTECDVLVIGGGPAGLTAALYLAQAKLRTILVDSGLPGGQVAKTHQVSNYPGFIDPIAGYELMHRMLVQAQKAGVEFRSAAEITSLDLNAKTIVLDGYETIGSKRVVVATGASPKPLGVKGELEYRGRGISYCATCDAKYYEGKDVVVIGGGNSAVEESLFISRFARKVTLVHQFAQLQANKTAQEKAFADPKINFLFEHEPREFVKKGNSVGEVVIENLKTKTQSALLCDGVFIFAGMKPNLELFEGQFTLDKWGYLHTDETMRTRLPGVFAAGDVRGKGFRQITTAVSDGTIAAISIANELA